MTCLASTARERRASLDADGLVVTPGFIDPHGHSDGSLFVDGLLTSHLRQGFTTQLSGNCGESLAPITDAGREVVELALRPNELVARWRTFAEYLDAVEAEHLGPNVAFLVGHGTARAAVMGAEGRPATDLERHAIVREVDAAMEAGAIGLSTGLIYAPGMHADADELRAVATAATERGGLYSTPHAQRGGRPVRGARRGGLDDPRRRRCRGRHAAARRSRT